MRWIQGRNLNYIAWAALLVGALSGCSESTDSSAPQTSVGSPALPAPRVDGAAASVLDFAQGSWISDCLSEGFHQPSRVRLVFSGLTIRHEIDVYGDSSCHQLLSTWESDLGVVTVHRLDNVSVDIAVNTTRVRMTTFGAYAKVASFSLVCLVSDWADSVPRDVSSQDCGEGMIDTVGNSSYVFITDKAAGGSIVYGELKLKAEGR
jgi:hypothetical protein